MPAGACRVFCRSPAGEFVGKCRCVKLSQSLKAGISGKVRELLTTCRAEAESLVMRKACVMLAAAVWILATTACRGEEPAAPVTPVAAVATAKGKNCPCRCSSRSSCRAFCHRLCDWLTYQPLSRPGPCGCCLKSPQCCRPPLFAFFLGNCCLSPVAGDTAFVNWEEPATNGKCCPH
jgi:hypothetical protein